MITITIILKNKRLPYTASFWIIYNAHPAMTFSESSDQYNFTIQFPEILLLLGRFRLLSRSTFGAPLKVVQADAQHQHGDIFQDILISAPDTYAIRVVWTPEQSASLLINQPIRPSRLVCLFLSTKTTRSLTLTKRPVSTFGINIILDPSHNPFSRIVPSCSSLQWYREKKHFMG